MSEDQRARSLETPPPTLPPLSSTLPRNFSYHYPEDGPPKTPEPVPFMDLKPIPLQPPRLRIKRRRPGFVPYERMSDHEPASDSRIPSIQLSDSNPEPLLDPIKTDFVHGYLAPSSSSPFAHSVTPPRTPLSQMTHFLDETNPQKGPWSPSLRSKIGNSISRPSSASSEMSDMSNSSTSSLNSSDTFPSYGESCTSPESETTEPFVFQSNATLMPSAMVLDARAPSKRQKLHARVNWSCDMDDHLWLTYMQYLSDPTVTPFKTLPETAPPLGVCHRVARRAKKSWKASRTTLQAASENITPTFASIDSTLMSRPSSIPLLIPSLEDSRPKFMPRSLSNGHFRVLGQWPRSAAATRRRLRELCKKKPTLSPHYQRLMHTRSPSPFESSSSGTRRRFTSPPPSRPRNSFSTSDLNITLTTSTAVSMQPDGPLSRLGKSDASIDQCNQQPLRLDLHQKSQSLQLGLGIGGSERANGLQRLASPFQEKRPHSSRPTSQPEPAVEIHHPRPLSAVLSGSMKRRAQYQLGEEMLSDDIDERRNFLEDMFRDPNANGKRRVRSRGFSVGAMSASGSASRQLSELFNAPPIEQPVTSQSSTSQLGSSDNGLMPPPPPNFQGLGRLGSPFAPTFGSTGMSNTFPRSMFPQGLDSISSLEQQREELNLQVRQQQFHDDPFGAPSAPRF